MPKKIDENIFIIGGGNIYEQILDFTDKIEVTQVHAELAAEVFFPKIDEKIWQKTAETCHEKDDKNEYDFCFQTWERKKPLESKP